MNGKTGKFETYRYLIFFYRLIVVLNFYKIVWASSFILLIYEKKFVKTKKKFFFSSFKHQYNFLLVVTTHRRSNWRSAKLWSAYDEVHAWLYILQILIKILLSQSTGRSVFTRTYTLQFFKLVWKLLYLG